MHLVSQETWKTRKFDDLLLQYCNALNNQNTTERWKKGCNLHFLKKGDFGIAKNYRGIFLTSIVVKIYDALFVFPVSFFYQHHNMVLFNRRDKIFHTFTKSMIPRVKLKARIVVEHTDYNDAIKYVRNYTLGTNPGTWAQYLSHYTLRYILQKVYMVISAENWKR